MFMYCPFSVDFRIFVSVIVWANALQVRRCYHNYERTFKFLLEIQLTKGKGENYKQYAKGFYCRKELRPWNGHHTMELLRIRSSSVIILNVNPLSTFRPHHGSVMRNSVLDWLKSRYLTTHDLSQKTVNFLHQRGSNQPTLYILTVLYWMGMLLWKM